MSQHPLVVSLSTACLLPLSLERTFRLAAEAGFEAVELVLSSETARLGAEGICLLARKYGLGIPSVHQRLMGTGRWGPHAARLEEAAEMAYRLDAGCAVLHIPWARRWDEPHFQGWLLALERAQRRLNGSPTRLAVENYTRSPYEGHAPLLSDPQELARFVQERGLMITYDTCHAATAGLDVLETYERLRPLIADIHLSDRRDILRSIADGHLISVLTHHQMPGVGDLPLRPFLRRLAEDGYRGPVSVEVNPVAMGVWAPPLRRRNLARILAYAREALD
ncbi:MAG: sugar phosphate isomerase/epimerase [Chloroflexi bacterium]|nr:sugar phosphate isomerase/epimerase [Chloroflexota bacterium]